MLRVISILMKLARNRSGNVAIITAFCVFPMVGIMGLAIDYAITISNKSKLDAAADAAAVSAITKAQSVITANSGATGTALSDGQMQGAATFRANTGGLSFSDNPTPTITVTRTAGQNITATVTYTATTQNQFGLLFNKLSNSFTGTSVASSKMPTYIGVYMALDISQSMGIGASQADMDKLSALTAAKYGASGSCVFGCHVTASGQTMSNELLAHNGGVTLRIDSLKSAVLQNISDAISSENGVALYKIGLYTMGGKDSSMSSIGLNTLIDATTNLSAVQTAANQIDLGPNNSNGVGDSNFSNAFVNGTSSNPIPFNILVPASGDGTSLSQAINYAMIITDGVSDVYGSCTYGHCTGPFDPALCTALKNKGVIVQVLYTTYIPFQSEQTYQTLVAPFVTQIQPNLQSCASSPANFYQASDATGIAAAMQKMFAQAIQPAVITQ